MDVLAHVNTVEPVLFVMPPLITALTVAVTAVLEVEIQPAMVSLASA